MTATRVCSMCGTERPLAEFETDKRKSMGHGYRCKPCGSRRAAAHYHADIERSRAAQRARAQGGPRLSYAEKKRRWPEKIACWSVFANAVRQGHIIKPGACSECGASGTVEGHHPDYGKPLSVDWLCHACHMRRHRKQSSDHGYHPRKAA